MSSTPNRKAARANLRVNAPPERVFDAWLDPAAVRRWMGAAGARAGMGELTGVEIDGRVGGQFRFVFTNGGQTIAQSGTYLDLSRPGPLAFSWDIALPDVERVVVEIVPVERGCELALTHELDPKWTGDVAPVEEAWAIVLEEIARLVEGKRSM